MNESRRQKRVANLIREELGRILIEFFQGSSSGIITITRIEMSKDLKTANIYFSFLGNVTHEEILEFLNSRKGYLRKSIASKVKLKYNPLLFFAFDPNIAQEEKIDKLIENIKENGKKPD
ncbi:30S ribosome-binding factor RbfA [Acidobacteriota bacterium]